MPTERTSITNNTLQNKLYERDIKIWSNHESLYCQNKSSIFSIALGQYSEAMKAKLESSTNYETINDDSDLIGLLKLIRDVSYEYESKQYPYLSVYNAVRLLYGNYQKNYMTVNNYLESFQNIHQVVDHCGGNFGTHPSLVQDILDKAGNTLPTTTETKEAGNKSRDAYLAMVFLCEMNHDKYQDLLDDLSNSYISGRDEYPKTVVDAHSLVLHWKCKKIGCSASESVMA